MSIVVVDYGMGNLRSVSKALEHLGAKVCVSDKADVIRDAERLVLPGVGAFGDAIRELHGRGIFFPLKDFIATGRPFLGICLGLQLLFTASEESPGVSGLGILSGQVRWFRSEKVKIPHMGWNRVRWLKPHPMTEGIPDQSYFYFVHSFYAPADHCANLGECIHGEEKFSAIMAQENLFATQFHPEKSQRMGLSILENFIRWKP